MKAATLAALLVPLMLGGVAALGDDPGRFHGVKQWYAEFRWSVHSEGSEKDGDADVTWTLSHHAIAHCVFDTTIGMPKKAIDELDKGEDAGDTPDEDDKKPRVDPKDLKIIGRNWLNLLNPKGSDAWLTFRGRYNNDKDRCSVDDSIFKRGGDAQITGNVWFNAEKGTYGINVKFAPDVKAKERHAHDGEEVGEETKYEISEQENYLVVGRTLPDKGLVLRGRYAFPSTGDDARTTYGPDSIRPNATIVLSWTLKPEIEPAKVYIDTVDPEQWPKNEGSFESRVWWEKNAAVSEIEVTLLDVTEEKGVCLNDKDRGTGPDFEFSPANAAIGWKVERMVLRTTEVDKNHGVFSVQCNDYGAWAHAKARAKIDGEWVQAKVWGTGKEIITIPHDENEDRIADTWKEEFGGGAVDEDSDERMNQRTAGDEITTFEEYRGFFTLTSKGERKHTRLDPRKKDMFAIDTDKLVDVALWKHASGITLHLLDPGDVQGGKEEPGCRIVDFCQGYAPGNHVYAVKLEKRKLGKDLADPLLGDEDRKTSDACAQPIRPDIIAECIRDTRLLILYPDRIRNFWVVEVLPWLSKEFPKMKEEVREGVTVERGAAAVNALKDPSKVDAIVALAMTRTVIHELGHACGAGPPATKGEHGLRDGPDGNKPAKEGVVNCPIRYFKLKDNVDFILDGKEAPCFKGLKFCTEQNKCWEWLTLKNQ